MPRFLARATFLALAACAPAGSQAQTINTIGVLSWYAKAEDHVGRLAVFVEELQRRGHEDGRTVQIDYRFAAGNLEKAKQFADEFARRKVSVIVAIPTPAAVVAKAATATLPVVFLSADPVASGLVGSFARPGGNLTGVSTLGAELAAKRLELLRDAIPGLKRIGFLSAAQDPNAAALFVQPTEKASHELGIDFVSLQATGLADLDRAFADASQHAVQALIVQPIFLTERQYIGMLARQYRITLVCEIYGADAGCPIAYGASQEALFVQMARQVDLILRGAKPGDMPVHQATEFRLILNLEAAKGVGLSFAPRLIARADEVIE